MTIFPSRFKTLSPRILGKCKRCNIVGNSKGVGGSCSNLYSALLEQLSLVQVTLIKGSNNLAIKKTTETTIVENFYRVSMF